MTNIVSPRNLLGDYSNIGKDAEKKVEKTIGKILNVTSASSHHEDIIVNTTTELKNKLRGRGCKVFSSNLRVKVPAFQPFCYPDLTVVCDAPIFEDLNGSDVLTNPSLIVEVLSPTTEAFDLNEKFTYYKSIETLVEYMVIAQEFPHVSLYTKQTEEVWLHREYNDLEAKFYLSAVDCEILMSEIYLDIKFDTENRPVLPFDRPEFR